MYFKNLDKKIAEAPEAKTIPTICAWSDLLGFSEPYKASDWNPDAETRKKIAERLRDAQDICVCNLSPSMEKVLVSNDAFVRNVDLAHIGHIEELSMWFRGLIWSHMGINSREKAGGYPGIRTVVAGGDRLIHNFEDVRFEDYVLNYTKRDPAGKSSFPEAVRERVLFYNPAAFQMNTGFSKSYILESAGSKAGLSGNRIYIDDSVFSVIKASLENWQPDSAVLTEEEREDSVLLYVENPENGWYHIGFELSKPFEVELPALKTRVYCLLAFYPWDEDPKTFRIDVGDDLLGDSGPVR